MCLRLAVGRERATDDPQRECQFLPVLPVASVSEIAEPLRGVGLRNDGAGTNNLPTPAPGVPSSTDLIQATLGRRQVLHLRQGALSGRFSGAIDIEDLPLSAGSIQQLASLLLFSERASEQIVEKQGAQGFDWLHCQSRQKARERRAGWKSVTVKQGHERDRKGLQSFVEGFQGAFTTDGVPEKDREKVDHLVVPEAPPRHPRTHSQILVRTRLVPKMLDDQGDFAKPGGRRGDRLARGLDDYRSIGDTVHMYLLEEKCFVLPSQ